QLLELPQASVAVKVRRIVKLPVQLPGMITSLCVTVGDGSQASVTVGVPVALGSVESVQDTVVFAGQVIAGGVVSTTVIVCWQVLLLPHASVAVKVRVIVSVLPQPGTLVSLNVTVVAPQVSEAVAVPVAAGLVSPVHSTVAFAGQVIVGGVVSTTVIVC